MEIHKNFFESKIKPVLTYVGAIGSGLCAIAYIILVCVLILGFEAGTDPTQTILFAIINGIFGLVIMQFLKVQGESFGRQLPENAAILKEYYATKTKDKKLRSMTYYWITSVIKDIIYKGITICLSTCCIIYIVITGSENYTLLLLAAVNLILFFSLGLLALSKTYDFFNNRHMNYIKEQLRIRKEEELEEQNICEILEDSKANMQSQAVEEFGVIEQNNSLNQKYVQPAMPELCCNISHV